MKEPIWIDVRDVLAIHGRLLALEGGPSGLRDVGLLDSALARPRHLRAYGEKVDISSLAAAYIVGIVRDHPFLDGNKRTGFLIGAVFLEMNGYRLTAAEADATQVIFSLAGGKLDEAALAVWIRGHIQRA